MGSTMVIEKQSGRFFNRSDAFGLINQWQGWAVEIEIIKANRKPRSLKGVLRGDKVIEGILEDQPKSIPLSRMLSLKVNGVFFSPKKTK